MVFTLIDGLFGMLICLLEPEGAVSGCNGVSCLLNFSLFFLALSSDMRLLSTMLTCFLSPEIRIKNKYKT